MYGIAAIQLVSHNHMHNCPQQPSDFALYKCRTIGVEFNLQKSTKFDATLNVFESVGNVIIYRFANLL